MFKIQLKNYRTYKRFSNSRAFGKYIAFDILNLHTLTNHEDFIQSIDRIRLSNGTFKTTSVNRFAEIDQYLASILDIQSTYSIHDLAVSDGTTSCELYELLKQSGINVQFQASDKFTSIVAYSRLGIKHYFDTDGNLIYGSILGIIADKRYSIRFLISKLLGYILHLFPKGKNPISISLLSPVLKSYLPKKIAFKEVDIFNSKQMEGSFDVIRCMNVLNRSYFDNTKIMLGLENIKNSLRAEGLLVIGRTDVLNRKNYASVFRINSLGAKELIGFGGGTEIADIVYSVFGKRESF